MRARRLGGNAARRDVTSAARELGGKAARRLGDVVRTLKRVCGMPDYESYVAHLRAKHPERPLPTEREYFDLYVKARYGDGPTRCC